MNTKDSPRSPGERIVGRHTPGPWQCYADLPSADPNWHIVTNKSRMRVLANVHIEPGNVTDEANARLIAAAPELLEAAQKALHYMRLHRYADQAWADDLDAAIAKALCVPPNTDQD